MNSEYTTGKSHFGHAEKSSFIIWAP